LNTKLKSWTNKTKPKSIQIKPTNYMKSNLSTKNASILFVIAGEFYQTPKNKCINLEHKNIKWETFLNLFYESSAILTLKPHKGLMSKNIYKPILFKNIDKQKLQIKHNHGSFNNGDTFHPFGDFFSFCQRHRMCSYKQR
jgi:hypothetical protein